MLQIPTPITRLLTIAETISAPDRFFYSSFPEFTPLEFEHFCAFLLQKSGHIILELTAVLTLSLAKTGKSGLPKSKNPTGTTTTKQVAKRKQKITFLWKHWTGILASLAVKRMS